MYPKPMTPSALSFLSLVLSFAFLLPAFQMAAAQSSDDSHTSSEQGWENLFDGTSTDAWRGYNMDEFPKNGWKIMDGELVFEPSDRGDWTSGLDIITKEKYGDFELEMEWMVSKGGNSGIFYHILEQPEVAIYWSALEMQVLDNEYHPDANMGKDGNRKAGSLYDLIPAKPQNTKPHGEWNQVRIISEGNHVEHWMNGEKVLEFERFTPEWFKMLRNSKFREHNEFGAMREGHIGLQDHGDLVKYRNIRIRRL